MINVFIVIEDSCFYEYYGIDLVGIFCVVSVVFFFGYVL